MWREAGEFVFVFPIICRTFGAKMKLSILTFLITVLFSAAAYSTTDLEKYLFDYQGKNITPFRRENLCAEKNGR